MRECKKPILMFVVMIALATCLIGGLAGCGSQTPTGNATLKVGVRADIVGFGHLNEKTGKYYGLEIDIANELADRLGYSSVEFVSVLPDDRKERLLAGEVDCLIACYSISESRLANFDFSPAYYHDKCVVMVENSSLIGSVDQLKGMTIGTMAGANTAPMLVQKLTTDAFTSGEVLVQNEEGTDYQFDTFRILEYASYEELSNALEVGEIDAASMDGSIAETYMRDNRALLDYTVAEQDYGVATQKDSILSEPVAGAIQAMVDDGTIASLVDKWN